MTEPAPGTTNPETADATSVADGASGDATTLVADTVPPLDPVRLDELEEAMRDVVDPELGINVVDLGLVYGISEAEETVTVDMTLTSAACPLTDVIEDQARNALVRSGMCGELRINWVWMPPWGPDKITEDGREQLRALGFTV
ncbi:metal-sulfur cluster assembly factor [Rhodococcus coprophilus]|uniref:Metal-sulfur cluster protein n=1 Tax=Rhodococcus coprophilus TaxID=38310 RepID=A0A2X4TNS7_9NOCA|nr:metal-sulfur cluster assembly factor [Rhodococcus coprophilus]MBM7461029.1 metal-sulfur cluster biosynthetic enzyme [Rhodococcus coprophilus]SQI28831.1 metal-sulfur cluster protein [Rhodococcus coprophilus]